VNVLASGLEFIAIADAVIYKSALPNWKVRSQPMRKTSFDESQNSLDSDVVGSQQEVNMIRHDDKCVQLIVALMAVRLQSLQK
jgi:hypothetical protein